MRRRESHLLTDTVHGTKPCSAVTDSQSHSLPDLFLVQLCESGGGVGGKQ